VEKKKKTGRGEQGNDGVLGSQKVHKKKKEKNETKRGESPKPK